MLYYFDIILKLGLFLSTHSVIVRCDESKILKESSDEFIKNENVESFFTQQLYQSTISEELFLNITNGPIQLVNGASSPTYYFITSDNFDNYEVVDVDNEITIYSMKGPEENRNMLYDLITLEAMDENYESIATTNILVFTFVYDDPYNLVYKVNSTEYIVLNYFYFKLFLLLIVSIGVLILAIEFHSIVKTRTRSNSYDPLIIVNT